jgi:hypothetical protein
VERIKAAVPQLARSPFGNVPDFGIGSVSAMNRCLLKFEVLGVLIVVLLVFMSAVGNLEPTAMRAWRAALMLAFFLSHISRTMIGRTSQLLMPLSGVDKRETRCLTRLSFDSSCPLLC